MRRLFILALLFLFFSFGARAQRVTPKVLAQTGGACGTGVAHCTVLSWTASTTSGVTYSVCRSTTSGAENCTVPINTSPITGTSYIDPITLTNSQQTFFYVIVAVDVTSFGTLTSSPSNEASATFPALPQAPTSATATPH